MKFIVKYFWRRLMVSNFLKDMTIPLIVSPLTKILLQYIFYVKDYNVL